MSSCADCGHTKNFHILLWTGSEPSFGKCGVPKCLCLGFRLTITIPEDFGVVETTGIKLDLSSPRITDKFRTKIRLGRYESIERLVVKNFGAAEDNFLELGGCLGYMACVALKMYPQSCVLSVEPDPSLTSVITRNVELNGFEYRHLLVPGAVGGSSSDKVMPFYVADDEVDAGTLHGEEFGAQGISYQDPVMVPRFTVGDLTDRFLTTFSRVPNFLLMDIEGSERELFRDEQFLELLPVAFNKVCIEYHTKFIGADESGRIRTLMLELGYELKRRMYSVYYYQLPH